VVPTGTDMRLEWTIEAFLYPDEDNPGQQNLTILFGDKAGHVEPVVFSAHRRLGETQWAEGKRENELSERPSKELIEWLLSSYSRERIIVPIALAIQEAIKAQELREHVAVLREKAEDD
jgi:hypothetical protein